MSAHNWTKSTLGHGDAMCSKCKITNREAAALHMLNNCEKADPEPVRQPQGEWPKYITLESALEISAEAAAHQGNMGAEVPHEIRLGRILQAAASTIVQNMITDPQRLKELQDWLMAEAATKH